MNVTVRPAREEDLDTVADYVIAMAKDSRGIELTEATVHTATRALFNRPELGFYIVAETEGRLAGSLLVTFEWSDWRNGVYWWIQSVYVHPEFRKQGVYREMHTYVTERVRSDSGVVGLNLYVYDKNLRARAAYERLGMAQSSSLIYSTPNLKSL